MLRKFLAIVTRGQSCRARRHRSPHTPIPPRHTSCRRRSPWIERVDAMMSRTVGSGLVLAALGGVGSRAAARAAARPAARRRAQRHSPCSRATSGAARSTPTASSSPSRLARPAERLRSRRRMHLAIRRRSPKRRRRRRVSDRSSDPRRVRSREPSSLAVAVPCAAWSRLLLPTPGPPPSRRPTDDGARRAAPVTISLG